MFSTRFDCHLGFTSACGGGHQERGSGERKWEEVHPPYRLKPAVFNFTYYDGHDGSVWLSLSSLGKLSYIAEERINGSSKLYDALPSNIESSTGEPKNRQL